MRIRGCEKLTEANVIVAYRLSQREPALKMKFHDELYGRHDDGVLSRIPHTKLAKGVVEIPQRNLDEVRRIFDKHKVAYELRITIPEKERDHILEITKTIEDPYEKSLGLGSLDFGRFVVERLEEIGEKSVKTGDLRDEMLAVVDTVQKWSKKHEGEPLADVIPYAFGALENKQSGDVAAAKRAVLRIAESLKSWMVGYHVLRESTGEESVGDVLRKYRKHKTQS